MTNPPAFAYTTLSRLCATISGPGRALWMPPDGGEAMSRPGSCFTLCWVPSQYGLFNWIGSNIQTSYYIPVGPISTYIIFICSLRSIWGLPSLVLVPPVSLRTWLLQSFPFIWAFLEATSYFYVILFPFWCSLLSNDINHASYGCFYAGVYMKLIAIFML